MTDLPELDASDVFWNEKILRSELHQKAEAIFLKKIEAGDADGYQRLADHYRQQGRLADAARIYQGWLDKFPDSAKAKYLAGLFNRQSPGVEWPEPGFSPGPFYIANDFLPQDLCEELFRFVLDSKDKFGLSTLDTEIEGKKQPRYLPKARSSTQVALSPGLKKRFLAAVQDELPAIRQRLGFDEYKIAEYTTMLVRHGAGDFLLGHIDHYEKNWITLVYYFCAPDVSFSGGGTLLYDTDTEAKTSYKIASFTQIPFANNRLAAFPGNYYHAVLPVRCDDNRFECARFTVVLWLEP